MIKAIFQEPSPHVDETWTHGAMFGGMCGYGEQDLADSYFLAGSTLIDVVLDGKENGPDLINPIMFAYRHGVELYLKCILQPTDRNHNLGALLEGLCKHIRQRYKENVPQWITKPISEFSKYDSGSDFFRYGTTLSASRSNPLSYGGELWVDLPSLKKSMEQLRRVFRRVIIADETGEIPLPGPPDYRLDPEFCKAR